MKLLHLTESDADSRDNSGRFAEVKRVNVQKSEKLNCRREGCTRGGRNDFGLLLARVKQAVQFLLVRKI